jgi:ABC-type multidrug transport system fused ATPase/permease subunit
MTKDDGAAGTTGSEPTLRQLLEPLREPFLRVRGRLVLTILFGWAKFFIPLAIPWVIGHVIDDVLRPGLSAEQAGPLLLHYGLIALVAVVLAGIATYWRHVLGVQLQSEVQHRLRQRLFHHLQRLSMAFFQRHHAGALGARVSSDIAAAGALFDKGIVHYAMDIALFLGVAVWLSLVSWQLTLLACLPLAITGFIMWRVTPALRRQQKAVQDGQSRITGIAAEMFAGITLVKASAGEHEAIEQFTERSSLVRSLQLQTARMQGRFTSVTHAMVVVNAALVAIAGAWLITHGHTALTIGALVAFIMYLGSLNNAMQRMIDNLIQLQESLAALERINDYLHVLPSPADKPGAGEPPIAGELAFREVRFAYPGKPPVLDGFSFTFRRGRSYALVGPSGSGKSTLAQLMLRFYDPEAGVVQVDGHDLRDIRQQWWRHHVAVVLQDPILFSASIADNIDFARDGAGQPAIEAAARAAQAHEFITALPDGYETQVGERGVSLSGGQRQRIAIARALLREPRLLILDEATSALDAVTERAIKQVVDALRGTRTVVVIAHRLSTIRDVDEILVLDHGRIAEHGGYAELLARGGLFSRLVAEQTRGED